MGVSPWVSMQNNLDKINRAVLVDLIGIRSNTRAWGARPFDCQNRRADDIPSEICAERPSFYK